MSQNNQPHFSLLSLSIAATDAARIPAESAAPTRSSQSTTTNTTKHRRLSSVGRSRRRLSDARDAATRPFPTSLQTASVSLAALSLSSPTTSHRSVPGAQPIQVPTAKSTKGTSELESASVDDARLSLSPPRSHASLASNSAKSGRKRGTIFTCESCSKVYRHPSCLIKHRWEHTPQWREASKFVLSKHQQVQLLEAAAILSHLSPSSASLPEDRSLWPSFLSGGLVPPPASTSNGDIGTAATTTTPISPPALAILPSAHSSFPVSSSVPTSIPLDSYRAGSAGPRLHHYAIAGGGLDIMQVRPGMFGIPATSMSATNGKNLPVTASGQTASAAATTTTTENDALNLLALREASVTPGSWGSPTPASLSYSRSHSRSYSHAHARAHVHLHSHSHSLSLPHTAREREWRRSNGYEYDFVSASSGDAYAPDLNGTWSLPSSSVRSKSGSSQSRSRSQSASESRSDDEDEAAMDGDGDVEIDLEDIGERGAKIRQARAHGSGARSWKTEDEEGGPTNLDAHEDEREDEGGWVRRRAEETWDSMEMEMEMD